MSELSFKIINDADDPVLREYIESTQVYVKPGVYAMSTRKLEALQKIAKLQRYYQCNPVRFIDDFFNIELIDAQAFAMQRVWNCPNVLVVATRG